MPASIPQQSENSKTSYYDTIMKQIITKEEVSEAIRQLAGHGKKPTLLALHAALDNKGSMSTLVRLKAEIEAEALRMTDAPEALQAFREVWELARDEGRKVQEVALADARNSLQALAIENERLEGIVEAADKRASVLIEAKSIVDAELQSVRVGAEREVSRAADATRNSGFQAAKALQDLADARAGHARQVAALQADFMAAQSKAHDIELRLVRAGALREAEGASGEERV
jgi:Plasmid replication region DNA-binding N-term